MWRGNFGWDQQRFLSILPLHAVDVKAYRGFLKRVIPQVCSRLALVQRPWVARLVVRRRLLPSRLIARIRGLRIESCSSQSNLFLQRGGRSAVRASGRHTQEGAKALHICWPAGHTCNHNFTLCGCSRPPGCREAPSKSTPVAAELHEQYEKWSADEVDAAAVLQRLSRWRPHAKEAPASALSGLDALRSDVPTRRCPDAEPTSVVARTLSGHRLRRINVGWPRRYDALLLVEPHVRGTLPDRQEPYQGSRRSECARAKEVAVCTCRPAVLTLACDSTAPLRNMATVTEHGQLPSLGLAQLRLDDVLRGSGRCQFSGGSGCVRRLMLACWSSSCDCALDACLRTSSALAMRMSEDTSQPWRGRRLARMSSSS